MPWPVHSINHRRWFILRRFQNSTHLMSNHKLPIIFNRISTFIDGISEWSGRIVAWLVLSMVLLVGYDVTMRYFFRSGSVALQELEWHLFSLIFLLGAAYTLKHDDHVRLDLVYKSSYLSDQQRAWINLLGSLLILIPFCLLIIFCSLPFVGQSFTHAEISPDPGGLPYRWILKLMIPLSFGLLLLQGVGDALKNIVIITESRK